MFEYYLSLIALMSLFTFIFYGVDKNRAVRGKYRIPEGNLFILTIFFGSIGGLLAMYLFRHKTKKLSFLFTNWFFLMIHVVIGYFIYV